MAVSIPPDLPPGLRACIGPYRVDGVLGQGGMGIVYRAVGPQGRAVAVKTLHAVLASAEATRRFEREARLRIDHENVVEVLDAGAEADGSPYIVFELLDGEGLDDVLERGGATIGQVVDVSLQACAGLARAHALGVVHRDLKPSNLFCCRGGKVKLLDFGIAFQDEGKTRLTAAESLLGTLSYLSPEQARGRLDLDARTDVWAMGAVLYHALSGVPPFEGGTPLATLLSLLMDDPVPLPVRAPETPRGLVAIVERALRKPREERWASADEMAAALGALDLDTEAAGRPLPPDVQGVRDATVEATTVGPARTVSLGAERRVVAVLLAAGVHDPAPIERAVEQRCGSFVPLMGGRALGLFGGQAWEGDEAVRAVAAGLYAREAADAVSVACGRALLSGVCISEPALRMAEAGCAARLPGVALDDETARIVAGSVVLRSVEPGLHEATVGQDPRWPVAGLDRPDAPAHGREPELALVRQAVEAAVDESAAAIVLVTGPAGIGKSRLRREVERMLEGFPERVWLVGHSQPHRRDAALSAFESALVGRARLGTLLRGWPSLEGGALDEERRAALASLVGEALSGARAATSAEFLGELLGVPQPGSTALLAARRDPQLMADRIRLALFDYFEGLSRKGPVALLVEDLQWADTVSLEVLVELVDRLAERPLVLFATARPEFAESRQDPFEGRQALRIALRGLSNADVGRLAAAVAGRTLSPELVRAITERTGGNPFFVEQIVGALADRGTLDDPADLPLPLTVEAAVQSRLDHLPPQEKELCKRASIFARPFTGEEALALGMPQLDALLSSLCGREIMTARVRSREGRREVHFRSALVAEVANRMLADDVREELHREVARVLRHLPEAGAEEVGLHHERGGQVVEAARCYATASLVAARRGDAATVLRCSTRALSLGAPDDLRYSLHLARVDALRFAGDREGQETDILAAIRHAGSEGDRARALTEQVVWHSRAGEWVEAQALAEEAVTAARASGDGEVLALARGRQAMVLARAGWLQAAREALEEATARAAGASSWVRALAATWRAEVASFVGDIGAKRDGHLDEARIYAETGDVRRAANVQSNLADLCNRVGAYAEAETALRSALEGCRRVGSRVKEGYVLANLGYSLTMLGRLEDALATLEEAAGVARATQDLSLARWVRLYRARALLRAGDAETACREAEDVAGGFAMQGAPGACVLALSAAARARDAHGEPEMALVFSCRAMTILDEVGSLEEDEIEVYATHARILAGCGRPEEARDVLARARRRLEQIAAGIADAEWRDRLLRDVPAHREVLSA